MDTIEVQQAVFSSSDRGSVKGYQLVSRSAGVHKTLAQELCRWAPTRMRSADPDDWTLNYFPVTTDVVAVTRTVLGGPEYSGRGGTQVVTLILLLTNDQFACYGCNPMAVAKTAMLMGYLKLPLDMSCAQMPLAVLPSRPIIEPDAPASVDQEEPYEELMEEVTDLIKDQRRVAVIGASQPIELVERLIPRLSVETRRDFSFTTGLSPSIRRAFQVHFLSSTDMVRQRTLDAQQIIRVDA